MSRLIALMVLIGMGGCSSLYNDYAIRDLTVDSESEYMKIVERLKTPTGGEGKAIVEPKCFSIPVAAEDKTDCMHQRNAALSALVMNSEKACIEHRKTIYGNEAIWNITSGTFTNLFSGAAAVASGAADKSVLSALALFSNSERSLANESVYKSVLVPAVDKKIVQIREARAKELHSTIPKSIDGYSVNQALHDVIAFHYSCSFMNGLRLALDEGVQDTSRQKVVRLRETLRSISAEMDAIPAANRAPAALQHLQYEALAARYESVSQEIKVLEKQ